MKKDLVRRHRAFSGFLNLQENCFSFACFMVIFMLAYVAPASAQLRIIDLGLPVGTWYTQANAINDQGQIMVDGLGHGFIWQNWATTELGTLGGGECYVRAMNNNGQVAGVSNTSSGATHGFLWQNGVMTDIGTLWGDFAEAIAINNTGQVVGYSSTPDGRWQGFIWQQGRMTSLGGGSESSATAVNDAGQVVGYYNSYPGVYAFLWQDGVMTDLGTLGGTFTHAWAINNAGQVVGDSTTSPEDSQPHAYLWQDGVMTDLGTLGGSYSGAVAINNIGQVVGQSQTALGDYHAFIWQNGVMTDLGTLGGNYSIPYAINNVGQVVGESRTASGDYHAFIWQNGVMTDLGTLGGNYSAAYDINNKGEVVGASNVVNDTEGHAVLWTTRETQALLTDLTALVNSFNLPREISGMLLDKLSDASEDLHDGDVAKACNHLNSFLNVIEAHSEKKITLVQANQMINAALSIRKDLGCI